MACGDPISEGRRRALPNACLCTECQARLDRSFQR
nr:TraR/DksA C4-type zinc finger protein [Plastoroseomonas hellenica]